MIAQRPANVDDVAKWIKKVYENGRKKQDKTSTVSTLSTPSTYPEIAANAALTLIAVAAGLLKRQIATLEKMFEQEGGFTERLYRVRQQARKNKMKAKTVTKKLFASDL